MEQIKNCVLCGGKTCHETKTECHGHGMFIKEHKLSCFKCGAHTGWVAEFGKSEEKVLKELKKQWENGNVWTKNF